MRRPVLSLLFFLFAILLPVTGAVWFVLISVPGELKLEKTNFSALEGWAKSDHDPTLQAFLKSCESIGNKPLGLSLPDTTTQDISTAFRASCEAAVENPSSNFFENHFDVYQMSVGWKDEGLLTGYYEPLLEASLEPDPDYPVALHRNPGDLITVDLGQFRENLEGTQLVGRLEGNRVVPYHSREEIVSGALEGRDLELLWVKDPVNAFFVQVQGSGRAKLVDGTVLRIGYGGKNGHPYTSIGRVLADEGQLELENVSLQTIRGWLADNPDQMNNILNRNASYVFFQLLETDGPIGSAGAVLTAGRSLATDPRYIPLGLPVWISGEMPDLDNPENKAQPLQRLFIAQDTGGAIKGELRGDVFWGFGESAEILAGHMKHKAEFYLLLPKGAIGEGAD